MTVTDELLGTCENLSWDRWDPVAFTHVNVRRCTQPAMQLIPHLRRNLCAACGADSEGFGDRLNAHWVELFTAETAAAWLAGSYGRYLDACYWAAELATRRAPLPELHRQQARADEIGELITLMVGRWGNQIRAAIRAGVIRPDDIGLTAPDLDPVL